MANLGETTKNQLKSIILSLKMTNFSVEHGAEDEIKAMIAALPSAEIIDIMNSEEVKELRDSIGGIMSTIDQFGRRDSEYKARYKSRTGLPPRYKVLDWKDMKAASNNVVRGLIKASAKMDDLYRYEEAKQLLSFAKKINGDSGFIKVAQSGGGIINRIKDWFNPDVKEWRSNEKSQKKEQSQFIIDASNAIKALDQYQGVVSGIVEYVGQLEGRFDLSEFKQQIYDNSKNLNNELEQLRGGLSEALQNMKQGIFDYGAPEATAPEATTPEGTTPEGTTPEATTPEAPSFSPGDAVTYKTKDGRNIAVEFVKQLPNGSVQVKPSSGGVVAVNPAQLTK